MTQTVLITAHGISAKERTPTGRQGTDRHDLPARDTSSSRRPEIASRRLSRPRHRQARPRRGARDHRGSASFDVIQSTEEIRTYPHQKSASCAKRRRRCAHAEEMLAAKSRRRSRTRGSLRRHDLPSDQGPPESPGTPDGRGRGDGRRRRRQLEQHPPTGAALPGTRLACVPCARPRRSAPEWFAGIETVGLTAGTSTLDETIDAVEHALQQISSRHSVAV